MCSVEIPSVASASSSREASLPPRPCPLHRWCALLNLTALLRGEPAASVGLQFGSSSPVGKLSHNYGPQLHKYTFLNHRIGPMTSPILQLRKPMLREVGALVLSHTVCKPCLLVCLWDSVYIVRTMVSSPVDRQRN